jgi:hypothetical protein
MKIRTPLTLVALSLAVSAYAGSDDALQAAADDNGLSLREMRMLAGAPSTHASYRTSYWQARDKLRRGYVDARPLPRIAEPEPIDEPRDSAETYALPDDR